MSDNNQKRMSDVPRFAAKRSGAIFSDENPVSNWGPARARGNCSAAYHGKSWGRFFDLIQSNVVVRMFAILVAFLVTGSVSAAEPDFKPDIPYTTIDGTELKLDLAIPAGEGPHPLVLCLHGGGFWIGDKSRLHNFAMELARHGYVAATVNYRFAPKYRFPAQLDDARTALRFLKSHAVEYKIDPDRVAAAGESAGAQLALLMGMMADDRKNTRDISTKVQCVLNYYAPTDFTNWVPTPFHELIAQQLVHKSIAQIMTDLFGTDDMKSDVIAAASPMHFVSADAPPIITFHGCIDPIIPCQQAELLHQALRKAGAKEKLVEVMGGHGHWSVEVKADADRQAIEWLDQNLLPLHSTFSNSVKLEARVGKGDPHGKSN